MCDAFSYLKVIQPKNSFTHKYKKTSVCGTFSYEKVILPKNSFTNKNKKTRVMFISKTVLRQIYFFVQKCFTSVIVFTIKTVFRQNCFFVQRCYTSDFLFFNTVTGISSCSRDRQVTLSIYLSFCNQHG